MRNFIWEGVSADGGSHLVRWDLAARPITHEGLSINRINDTNVALQCKWLWQFIDEYNSLGKSVIRAKYAPTHPLLDSTIHIGPSSKSICPLIIKHNNLFSSNICKSIKNGRNIRLWYDNWTGTCLLCNNLPKFYALIDNKECTVVEA